jgi:hypothetical protein
MSFEPNEIPSCDEPGSGAGCWTVIGAQRFAVFLEVQGGSDHRVRLMVDSHVRTIGRAREADLVLTDRGVSRRHIQVTSSERGVHLQACAGSAAFIVAGKPRRSFDAQPGDQIVVGTTLLVVTTAEVVVSAAHPLAEVEVQPLLTGVGADALALASLYSLIDELDAAGSRELLSSALESRQDVCRALDSRGQSPSARAASGDQLRSSPREPFESELFGHERGATVSRAGALESAGAGTLFLDEIGEISTQSQAKLLRALEEKKFERVGSNETLKLRARVICATNRDLAAMAKDGRFRSDLLYRISVVKVTIPPLRERGEDLVLLAKQLLGDLAPGAHRHIDGFSDAALETIRLYPWPGNVRELRNAIEHAIVLGEERLIQQEDFPAGIQARPGDPPDRGSALLLVDAVDGEEKEAIADALRAAGGNRTRAAAILGVARSTLYDKLRRL